MKEKENIKVTSHCLPGNLQEWYNLLVVYMVQGWKVEVTSQILLGLSFGANVNNIVNVTIRNSGFFEKFCRNYFFYVQLNSYH